MVPGRGAAAGAHLRDDLDTITFGPGGEVMLLAFDAGRAEIEARGERIELELPYAEPYNLLNTLAAVGAALALGVRPGGPVEPRFSSLRGEIVELPGGVTVVNDCYNANPMSMRAALQHLAETPAERRVAMLGTMAELGPARTRSTATSARRPPRWGSTCSSPSGRRPPATRDGFDGETYAAATPEEAGALLEEIALPGDRVLIKGSRSVGLERVLA